MPRPDRTADDIISKSIIVAIVAVSLYFYWLGMARRADDKRRIEVQARAYSAVYCTWRKRRHNVALRICPDFQHAP
jgi:hypothetical protein